MSSPAPSLRRTLAAAVLVLPAVALTGGDLRTPLAAYALSVPVIILSGGTLIRRLERDEDRWLAGRVFALLLTLPAMNLRFARAALDGFDAGYLAPGGAVHSALRMSASTTDASGPLLVGTGLALVVLGGRRAGAVAGAALFGGLASLLAGPALRHAADAVLAASIHEAVSWFRGALALGLLAAAGALLGARLTPPAPTGLPALHRRAGPALTLVATLAVLAAARPPTDALLGKLAIASTTIPVPEAAPGRTWSLASLDPEGAPMEAQLAAQNRRPMMTWPPRCRAIPLDEWARTLRAPVGLALPADETAARLGELSRTLYTHGLTRVVLTGHTDAPGGALGRHLAWPGAAFLVDAPPAGARVGALSTEGLRWSAPGRTVCVLEVAPDVSVRALYDTLRLVQEGPTAQCPGGVVLRLEGAELPESCVGPAGG